VFGTQRRHPHPGLPRLRVADHALDRGEAPAQAALDAVDPLMHRVDAHAGIDVAVEVDDLAVARLAHAHVVNVAQRAVLGRERDKRGAHRLDPRRRRVTAGHAVHLQRLDMALDLDVGAELVAHRGDFRYRGCGCVLDGSRTSSTACFNRDICDGWEKGGRSLGNQQDASVDGKERLYLCHRGADAQLVKEIADHFRRQAYYDVIVQEGDGMSMPYQQFRQLVREHLEADCAALIVILNKNFPGQIYRHTLGQIEAAARRAGKRSWLFVRVDDCDSVNSLDYYDLADAKTPEERGTALARGGRRRIR